MTCCLTTPSHYLNKCWLISTGVFIICLRAILQEVLMSLNVKSAGSAYTRLKFGPHCACGCPCIRCSAVSKHNEGSKVKTYMYFFPSGYYIFQIQFSWWGDIIQNGQWDLRKSCSTTSVNLQHMHANIAFLKLMTHLPRANVLKPKTYNS